MFLLQTNSIFISSDFDSGGVVVVVVVFRRFVGEKKKSEILSFISAILFFKQDNQNSNAEY